MSTLLIPDEFTRATSLGRASLRDWVKGKAGVSNPSPQQDGPFSVHAKLAPVAAQALLGEQCNAMILEAVSTDGTARTEQLQVATGEIDNCLRTAREAHERIVHGLSATVISPVDVDDLLRLSRLFAGNVEHLFEAALAMSRLDPRRSAVEPFHRVLGTSLAVSSEALQDLGSRSSVGARAAKLRRSYQFCRAFCREHFDPLIRENPPAAEMIAIFGARGRYLALSERLNEVASVLSRVALKNG